MFCISPKRTLYCVNFLQRIPSGFLAMADPVEVLKGIAQQFRTVVRSTNLFDPNVCTSPVDPKRPWEHLALPGDIFRYKLDIGCKGHKVTLRANGEFVVIEMTGSFDVDVCSINRRDQVFQLESSSSRIPGFSSLPVFSRQPDTDVAQFLRSKALQRALIALQPTNTESVHFYRNGIVVYLCRDSHDQVMFAIEVLCTLAEEMPTLDKKFDEVVLPAQFEGLSDLVRKWAAGDDEARSELIAHASREVLECFVTSVMPYIPAINDYLGSFGTENPPEAAVALGTLAECAMEAQLRLQSRLSI